MDTIEVFVEDLNECYSPFDHDDISQELVDHIDLQIGRTRSKNIVINIVSDKEISAVDKESLVDSIKAHYQLAYFYNRNENKQMYINNAIILLVGILFLIFKNHIPMGSTASDITDILAWITIWTAVENMIFTDYSQDSYARIIKKVIKSTITFSVSEE